MEGNLPHHVDQPHLGSGLEMQIPGPRVHCTESLSLDGEPRKLHHLVSSLCFLVLDFLGLPNWGPLCQLRSCI